MGRQQFFHNIKRLFAKKWWLSLPLFFLFPVMVSCGGAGSDVLAGGGIGGSGNTSVGPITALGSIFVNGIEFQTTNAAVTMNGVTGDEKELQVGMVVKVEGTVNADGKTGKADRVIFDNNVAGTIDSIDLGKSTMEVMAQTVIVDAQTIIAGLPGNAPGLADLAANDIVEISGLADADGNVMATRITLKTTGRQPAVSGRVSSLTTTTFKLNSLTVDYSKATLSKVGAAGLQAGDMVNVTGNLTSSTALLADVVEKKSPDYQNNSNARCQGFIVTLYYTGQSVSGFAIITPLGLQRVELDTSTIYSGGNLVKVGVKVQVEGTIQNNIIQAKKVDLLASVKMMVSPPAVTNPSFNGPEK
jgi:hypothetical protein